MNLVGRKINSFPVNSSLVLIEVPVFAGVAHTLMVPGSLRHSDGTFVNCKCIPYIRKFIGF
jgi:hypothetical protein